MDKLNQEEIQSFIAQKVISPFYEKRLNKLKSLQLNAVLKRKNPYLFKAKNIQTAEELVKYILDAFLSSQEETIFGNLMEDLAIHVCQKVFGGQKAEQGKYKSVNLIFGRNRKIYIVSIKSGPAWGNKDQIDRMVNNFISDKEILATTTKNELVAVNGCMYGKDNRPLKGDGDRSYYKLCGQEFWSLVSGDDDFYQRIVVPIDKEAKVRDERFKKVYFSKINELTKDLSNEFLTDDGQINWEKIISFVSKKNDN